jgi:hypothetical protein
MTLLASPRFASVGRSGSRLEFFCERYEHADACIFSSHFSKDESMDSIATTPTAVNSLLLGVLLSSGQPKEKFESDLQQRLETTKSLFVDVLSLIDGIQTVQKQWHDKLDAITSLTAEHTPEIDAIRTENERLNAVYTKIQKDLENSQIKSRSLLSEKAQLENQLKSTEKRVDDLSVQLDDTRLMLTQVERSLLREKSAQVQKINATAQATEAPAQEVNEPNNTTSNEPASVPDTPITSAEAFKVFYSEYSVSITFLLL